MTKVVSEIKDYNKNAIYIVVSNPLDAMVYACLKVTGLPRNRVIGMAGVLDSARMAFFISEELGKNKCNIQASVMGGHGNDMLPLVNYSSVDMKPLNEVLNEEQIARVIDK
ncbi:MAG: malate dehydrogenase, partial [Arcobacter sp.]